MDGHFDRGSADPAQARPTLTFAGDGTVSGTSGCNQFSGAYRRDGGSLQFGGLSSTLMGCDGERGAQETAFWPPWTARRRGATGRMGW